jgi:hypothetical protein
MKYRVLLVSFFLCSCFKDQPTSPVSEIPVQLKSKTYYSSIDSTQILSVYDYFYNEMNQLQLMSYYGGNREILWSYDLYQYSLDGNIRCKLHYHSNINAPSGFLLLDSTEYSYSSGVLIAEKNVYPQAGYFNGSTVVIGYSDSNAFEYDGSALIKKSHYHRGVLESSTTFLYEQNQLVHTNSYSASNSTILDSMLYYYHRHVLDECRYYSSTTLVRIINYSYDAKERLIKESVSEVFPASSSMSHIIKYEYY